MIRWSYDKRSSDAPEWTKTWLQLRMIHYRPPSTESSIRSSTHARLGAIGAVRIQPPGVGAGGYRWTEGGPGLKVPHFKQVKSEGPGATAVEAGVNTVVSEHHLSLDQLQLLLDNRSSGITHFCDLLPSFRPTSDNNLQDSLLFHTSRFESWCSNFRPST